MSIHTNHNPPVAVAAVAAAAATAAATVAAAVAGKAAKDLGQANIEGWARLRNN